LQDFASALEGVGLVLTAGEIRAIGHNFLAEVAGRARSRSPTKGDRSKSPSKGGSVGIDYFSFVKFLLEAATMNRGVGAGNGWDDDGGGGGGPRRGVSVGDWWVELPKVAKKLKGVYKKARNKKKWIKALKEKLEEKEDENGGVSGRKFKKVLSKSKIKLGGGMLSELVDALGGEEGCDWNSFVEVFTADVDGDKSSSDDDKDDSSDDDDDSSDDGGKRSRRKKKKKSDSDDDSSDDDSDNSDDSDGSSGGAVGDGLFQLFAMFL